jgi:hypothetical protein
MFFCLLMWPHTNRRGAANILDLFVMPQYIGAAKHLEPMYTVKN